MVYAKYKGTGSMSHSFVLVRMTAHLIIRGRIFFATYPPVLCSVLPFLILIYRILGFLATFFSLLVCDGACAVMEVFMKIIISSGHGIIRQYSNIKRLDVEDAAS